MPKVILISDQPVLLCGFEYVLKPHGFDIAAACSADELAVTLLNAPQPDIAVLDITAGLTFGHLTDIHTRMPECPVVLWADTMPLDLVFRTLEFGVRGIVPRISSAEHLADSLRRVASGEMQIGFGMPRDGSAPRRKVTLTPREREIVNRLRQGLRNKQIAAEMNITEGTVKIYLFRLFHKLGVRNRFELARCGVVDQMQFSPAPPVYMSSAQNGAGPGDFDHSDA